jgi:wyosine [tRNA(Phe)-imidazoG37] synthetase (radical SAM superfamily)
MHTVFGPVYSRRLGWSLGINNLPDKICSYSCAYCQAGNTRYRTIHRKAFFSAGTLYHNVRDRLNVCAGDQQQVDYITIVPNGEPTLDKNLRTELEMLKRLGHKVAVITNGSLLWMRKVREALSPADWVSVKIDCTAADIWKRLNRPHKSLNIDRILGGVLEFRDSFHGTFTTETMLVKDINDHWASLESVARFLTYIKPDACYISVPVRPPAQKNIGIPFPENVQIAEKLFHVYGLRVTLLQDVETPQGPWPTDLIDQLISIARVHPVDEDSVKQLFSGHPAYRRIVRRLLHDETIQRTVHNGKSYYVAGRGHMRSGPGNSGYETETENGFIRK